MNDLNHEIVVLYFYLYSLLFVMCVFYHQILMHHKALNLNFNDDKNSIIFIASNISTVANILRRKLKDLDWMSKLAKAI